MQLKSLISQSKPHFISVFMFLSNLLDFYHLRMELEIIVTLHKLKYVCKLKIRSEQIFFLCLKLSFAICFRLNTAQILQRWFKADVRKKVPLQLNLFSFQNSFTRSCFWFCWIDFIDVHRELRFQGFFSMLKGIIFKKYYKFRKQGCTKKYAAHNSTICCIFLGTRMVSG